MKHTILTTLILSSSIYLTVLGDPIVEKESKVASHTKDTVESLSEEFFALVMSPAELTLSIKDEATLKKATEELANNTKQIQQLAKKLQKLDIPDAQRRSVIDDKFTKEELKMRDTVGKRFMEHLASLKADTKVEWSSSMQEFYKSLDANKSVFENYFSKNKEKSKGVAPNP